MISVPETSVAPRRRRRRGSTAAGSSKPWPKMVTGSASCKAPAPARRRSRASGCRSGRAREPVVSKPLSTFFTRTSTVWLRSSWPKPRAGGGRAPRCGSGSPTARWPRRRPRRRADLEEDLHPALEVLADDGHRVAAVVGAGGRADADEERGWRLSLPPRAVGEAGRQRVGELVVLVDVDRHTHGHRHRLADADRRRRPRPPTGPRRGCGWESPSAPSPWRRSKVTRTGLSKPPPWMVTSWPPCGLPTSGSTEETKKVARLADLDVGAPARCAGDLRAHRGGADVAPGNRTAAAGR